MDYFLLLILVIMAVLLVILYGEVTPSASSRGTGGGWGTVPADAPLLELGINFAFLLCSLV